MDRIGFASKLVFLADMWSGEREEEAALDSALPISKDVYLSKFRLFRSRVSGFYERESKSISFRAKFTFEEKEESAGIGMRVVPRNKMVKGLE